MTYTAQGGDTHFAKTVKKMIVVDSLLLKTDDLYRQMMVVLDHC